MDRGRHSNNSRFVDRHRAEKRDRPSPYSREDYGGRRPGGNPVPPYNRVFVSNIPYDETWQNIKDLFRQEVGEVTYVELIKDAMGKSRGFGIIEFKTKTLAEEAIKKMRGYEMNKRKIVVKEDFNGLVLNKAMMRERGREPGGPTASHHSMPPNMPPLGLPEGGFPRAGLPPNIPPGEFGNNRAQETSRDGPIGNTVFVANLDYKVTYAKLKEVFKLAGNVVKVDLHLDKDNRSRGMATITYETTVEALQAISMFHKQVLFDRLMLVRMDKGNAHPQELPSGLQGIGPSLDLGRVLSRPEPQARLGPAIPPLFGNNSPNLPMVGANMPGTGIPGLSKPVGQTPSMGDMGPQDMNLPLFKQPRNPLMRNNMGFDSGRRPANSGMARPADAQHFGNCIDDQPFPGSRRIPGIGISDRERIERDIARVDSRIRDLDRSMAAVEDSKANIIKNGRAPNCTIFVRNLPFNMTWQNLRDIFVRSGDVHYADIKMENGKSKGYGRVRFATPEQAEEAIRRFNGTPIDGRMIEVRLSEERQNSRPKETLY